MPIGEPPTAAGPVEADRGRQCASERIVAGRPDAVPARLPNIDIDVAELNEYSKPSRSNWIAYRLGIALALAVAAGSFWRWTRARMAMVIVALSAIPQPWCSPDIKEVTGRRACPTRGQAAMPVLEFVGRIGNPSHAGTRINRLVGQTLTGGFDQTRVFYGGEPSTMPLTNVLTSGLS